MEANITKEEFVAAVTKFVWGIMPEGATDHDRKTVRWTAELAWDSGFTYEDAVYYACTFEEVNPHLPEEVAFARQAVLRDKYLGKGRARFEALP